MNQATAFCYDVTVNCSRIKKKLTICDDEEDKRHKNQRKLTFCYDVAVYRNRTKMQ